MITALLSWRITHMSRMESWSLRWIRSLGHLSRTPNHRQRQIQIQSRSRSRSLILSPMTVTSAQHHNLTMMPSCMAILVNHRNITRQAAAQAALNATSPGLQAILIVGNQLTRPAVAYLIKRPQKPTSMAKRLLTLKLVSVPRVVSNAVGAGPRTVL